MKSIGCASLIITALVGPLQAAEKSVFTTISETAPRSAMVLDDLNLTAPRSIWDSLNETAPRSDGVFGELEKNAP